MSISARKAKGTRIRDSRGDRVFTVVNYIILTLFGLAALYPLIYETACADVAEERVWTLTDAIADSDVGTALRTLRELLDMGVNEFQILGSLNWLLKSAYAVAAKTRGLPRMSSFVARKVAPLAQKIGEEKMRDAFGICMDTEILLRSTHVDRALALELLVTKLAAPTARQARARQTAER